MTVFKKLGILMQIHSPVWIYLISGLILVILISLIQDLIYGRTPNRRHLRYIATAGRVCDKLRDFQEPNKEARQLLYLRKINPYVFEELLLTLFKEQGLEIFRNKSYSNDGGLDGKIRLQNGKLVLIQAKRYKGHINKRHIVEFEALIKAQNADFGYFMHTGRTSKINLESYRDSNLIIYSGSKLLSLLTKMESIDELI